MKKRTDKIEVNIKGADEKELMKKEKIKKKWRKGRYEKIAGEDRWEEIEDRWKGAD